jgi:hypothetical protein
MYLCKSTGTDEVWSPGVLQKKKKKKENGLGSKAAPSTRSSFQSSKEIT